MKHFYKLLFSIAIVTSLQGMQQQYKRKSCYSKLSHLVYKATTRSWCGRNDYLYLANSNSLWYLAMKLQDKEQIEDINRYYLRYAATFNKVSFLVYITPLHEAVQRGNLSAVIMLCNAGADKTLTIKSDIETAEAAEQCYKGYYWISSYSNEEQKIEAWNKSKNLGLSVLELAEKLNKESADSKNQERKLIYQFLKDGKVDF